MLEVKSRLNREANSETEYPSATLACIGETMKTLLALLTFFVLSCAGAQSTYIGLRLAGASSLDESAERLPYLGLQVGIRVTGPLEFRAAFDTFLLASSVHADLLYAQPLGGGAHGYLGAGLDLYANVFVAEANYGAHATAGLEYRTGIVGLFAEAQPIYAFSAAALRARLGLGVNFHF